MVAGVEVESCESWDGWLFGDTISGMGSCGGSGWMVEEG